MKVSLIQMNMHLADPQYNYEHARKLVKKAMNENPDVLVFPETWNTGFFPKNHLSELSDVDGKETAKVLGGLAKEYHVNIVGGSVSNVKAGKVYNTSYIFDREGNSVGEYDKIHVFTPMKEDDFYEKGDHLGLFELDGHRCGIVICYDIRFPELLRSIALKSIDVLFVVAQWPDIRNEHWKILTRARAIENQIFLAACCSCGKAGGTQYGGSSVLLDPWGKVICEAGGKEEITSGDINFDILTQIRSSINVYADRRPDLYKNF